MGWVMQPVFPVADSIAGFAGLTHEASLPFAKQRFIQQHPIKNNLFKYNPALERFLFPNIT